MSADDAMLRRAAHAVLLAGFDGPAIPAWLQPALAEGLGGVCLYGANLDPAADNQGSALASLARSVCDLAASAIVAIDEEGGDVTRLHAATGSPYAGAAALGRYDDEATTRVVAAGIGAELASAGIWLDLAPCADVNSDAANPVIGTRSFGDHPQAVGRHVAAFVGGLADAGVTAAVKHFPGHGDTRVDSHWGLPVVRADAPTLHRRELAPFRAALVAGVECVMTSHVVLTALDPNRPATMSHPVLTGLLRDELGFDGVIVTDALDMAGAGGPEAEGIAAVAVQALAAGADLLCLGPEPLGAGGAVVARVVDELVAAVDGGRLPAERLVQAAGRVDRLRAERASLADGRGLAASEQQVAAAVQASRRVAAAVIDGPVAVRSGAPVIHLETGASPAVGDSRWGLGSLGGEVTWLRPEEVASTPEPHGPVVLVARRATSEPRTWLWIEQVLTQNPEAVLVEMGWPDPELSRHRQVICTWGGAAVSGEVLTEMLRGQR